MQNYDVSYLAQLLLLTIGCMSTFFRCPAFNAPSIFIDAEIPKQLSTYLLAMFYLHYLTFHQEGFSVVFSEFNTLQ
jgi:hypothetical protein